MKKSEKQRNFRIATCTGSAFLVVFALAGQQILALFEITLYSFMIVGGGLLLLVSVNMLIRGETMQKVGEKRT